MKSDPMVDDPLDIAEARLAHAFAEAKGALVDVRNKPSPMSIALAASEKKCRNLEAGMAKMKRSAMNQTQALADARALRTAADRRFADLDSQVKEDRVVFDKERETVKVAQHGLEKDRARCTVEAKRLADLQSRVTKDRVVLDKERLLPCLSRSLHGHNGTTFRQPGDHRVLRGIPSIPTSTYL
ncbi:hypothetical protein C8R46DRAFT_1065709, partial [Mycena filopes]